MGMAEDLAQVKPEFDPSTSAGWLLAITIYVMVWNSNINHMMLQAAPMISTVSDTMPLQRKAVFLVGVYTALRATLLITLILLLMFCLMTCTQCMLKLCIAQYLARTSLRWQLDTGPKNAHPPGLSKFYQGLQWFFAADVIFQALQPRFLVYHAAVLCAVLLTATVYAVIYPSDKDLKDPNLCRSLIVRDALCMATVGVMAYIVIGFYASAS